MSCPHDGYHTISTSYDRHRGLLVFHWSCERCGAPLREARREPYRPSFDPRGNDALMGGAPIAGYH
jgi:hypothetical protein